MQRAKTHVMISIFLMSFIYLFGIRVEAAITTFTLDQKVRIVSGGAVSSTISLGSILEGDSVLFSGTCDGTSLGDLTLACDKSGNDTIWTDSGSEHIGNRLGVVTATSTTWSMSVGQEYTFTKPGLYRVFCWSYGVPGPMTYIQVRPKKPGIPTNATINGGIIGNGGDFFASGKDTITLKYTVNWEAVTSYVSIGEYHSGTNWPDITGWAGKEIGLGTDRVMTIDIDIFDLMQKANLGNGTYRLCIYAGSGRGGMSNAYIIWIRVGWTLKAGAYSGGTLTIANANNANEKYATTSAGTLLFQNKPFKITAKPNSGYYLEKVVITKRHYTSKTTYTDTDVTQYSTPTQSQYQSESICYHAVGNNSYITPSVDEVIVTPYFKQQKTLPVSVANVDRVYEDQNFNGIMVVSYANSGTVQYGTSTSYGYTATVTQSDGKIQLSGVKRKNVGTTTVYWRVYVDETYQVKTGSFTITVTQRPIDVIAYDQTITYGSSIDTAHTAAIASGVAMYHVLTAVTLTPSTASVTSNGTITPSAVTIYNANRTENTTSQYKINYIAGKLVINKKELTPTVNANNKTYDGNTTGSGTISLTGKVGSDAVSATASTYTFDNKNVGTGKTVTASGIKLSGAAAGNYSIASSATGKANITARSVSPALSAANKTYDGTTTAQGTISLSNVVTGDSVTCTPGAIHFDNKNVGTGKTVTATGLTINNANYTLSATTAAGTANITARSVTPSLQAVDKTYDGTTTATGTLSLSGVLGGDSVTCTAGAIYFDNKNVGTDKTVTATGLKINNANYVLSKVSATDKADIIVRTVIPHLAAQDKTYDGTTTAQGTVTLSNLATGDTVSATAGTILFDNKNVGLGKNVTATEIIINDSNYILATTTASNTANIFAKTLTFTVKADDKTYDGTTNGFGVIQLDNAVPGDSVSATAASYTFENKNVGVDIAVVASEITLSGNDKQNYLIAQSGNGKANIIKRSVTPILNADNKMYDGTTSATGKLSLENVVAGDSVTCMASAMHFDNEKVGTQKTVTATGLSLDNNNYTLSVTIVTGKASITLKELVLKVIADNKVYDGNVDATGKIDVSGMMPGDNITATATNYVFADKNVGTAIPVTATGIIIVGDAKDNYAFASTATGSADITPKPLVLTAWADSKEYDTTTDAYAMFSVEGVIGSDVVSVTAENIRFDSPLPGEVRTVTASDFVFAGKDGKNYMSATPSVSTIASIWPRDLGTVVCVSPDANIAKAEDMQEAIRAVLGLELPVDSSYCYGNTTIANVNGDYVRKGDYFDALGIITDTFGVEIQVEGIAVAYGQMEVTTGTNAVYGSNCYMIGNTFVPSAILSYENAWTMMGDHRAYIYTNTPTRVSFRVYLKRGQSIQVGTEIGMHCGRVDVAVKMGNSVQAEDKIDAFFPVTYQENYMISDMRNATLQEEINESRGDYWGGISVYKASRDGLYSVEMNVTGSSYLLDAKKGLGTMYQGDNLADPPKTTLYHITIR